MSIDAAQAKLQKGIHDLHAGWATTRMLWRDAVSEQFERQFLASLDKDLRTTLAAMDHLRSAISQARNDCS